MKKKSVGKKSFDKKFYSSNEHADWCKNYRVKDIDTGMTDAILQKLDGLLSKRDIKIIFLVAEETDG